MKFNDKFEQGIIITTYILVILAIIQTVSSIFLGNVILIFKGMIYIAFTISLFFKAKSTNKNKVVEITFFISVALIILFNTF